MMSCALNSNWNVCFSMMMMMMSSCDASSMTMKRRTCACHGWRNCCYCCDLYRAALYPSKRRKNCCRCCSCDGDQTTTMMRRTCACHPYHDGLTTMSCDVSYFPRDPYLDVYPCHLTSYCCFYAYPYRYKVKRTNEYEMIMVKNRRPDITYRLLLLLLLLLCSFDELEELLCSLRSLSRCLSLLDDLCLLLLLPLLLL